MVAAAALAKQLSFLQAEAVQIVVAAGRIDSMITVSEEHAIDYGLTARLATEAFASPTVHFTPERTRWLYERSFGGTTMVVAAFDDGRKIGQVALIGQTLCIDGERFSAIQLVDL